MKIYKILSKLSVEILPLFFWVLLLFGFDKAYIAIITLLSAVIHELGHFIAILLLKCDTGMPFGHFSGFLIKQKSITSYRKSIIILLCGPMANIAAFLLLILLSEVSNYFLVAAFINFATAISNLLPIKGHDGYSVLSELFKLKGYETAIKAIEVVSFALCLTATFLSLYMMYYLNAGYWIFGIFIITVLSEMSARLKTTLWKN